MGNCSSCLGHGSGEQPDDDEERLLFSDSAGISYNSFGESTLRDQDTSAETQREVESLQQVVAKTANNMVDIFDIISDSGDPDAVSTLSSAAPLSRYNHLAAKLAARECSEVTLEVDWVQTDGHIDAQPDSDADLSDDEPLVGTFADAAAAMA